LDPLPNLDSAIAIRDTVARLISDVYEGKLHPRIVAGLARPIHLQLRADQKQGSSSAWRNWSAGSETHFS
jgi:hypothetical protein